MPSLIDPGDDLEETEVFFSPFKDHFPHGIRDKSWIPTADATISARISSHFGLIFLSYELVFVSK